VILARLSIAARLYLLLGLATFALFLVIGASVVGSGRMAEAGRLLHDRGALGIEEASHVALLFERQRGFVSRAPAETELDRQKKYRAGFVALNAEIDATLARLAPLVVAAAQDKVPQLAALFQTLRKQAVAVFDLSESFVQDKAIEVLNGPFSETNKQVEATLTALLSSVRNTADGQVVELSAARDFQIMAIAAVSLIGLVIVDGFGIFLARGLARRLRRITAAMAALSGGDMEVEVAAANDRDEIGEMARALQVFKDNMIEARRLETGQRGEQVRKEQRQQHVEQSVHEFNRAVSASLQALADAATELRGASETVSSTALETNLQAIAVSSASEQATGNVRTVAAALQELSASIEEIARQVTHASEMAGRSVGEAQRTDGSVRELVDERLRGEGNAVAPGCAERASGHADRDHRRIECEVRNEVLRELRTSNAGARSEVLAFAERHEVISPRDNLARRVEATGEVVKAGRPIEVVLDVVFTRPQELHRHAGDLRDPCGLHHVIVVQTPAEAAA